MYCQGKSSDRLTCNDGTIENDNPTPVYRVVLGRKKYNNHNVIDVIIRESITFFSGQTHNHNMTHVLLAHLWKSPI